MLYLSKTYRFISLSLAGLILVTSVGYAIDMHFCQGDLKSYSFFGKAKNCHEGEQVNVTCHHHKKISSKSEETRLLKKNCCSNKTLHFQLQQNQINQDSDLLINHPIQSFVLPVHIPLWQAINPDQIRSAFEYYKPPSITREIIILIQSYLL
jgi:hypothetical protein